METRLIALKLILNELDVKSDVTFLPDRKRIQKIIYLGQAAGVDLGYHYGWYLIGPYSTSLAKDYFALADAIESEEKGLTRRKLLPETKSRLNRIKPLLQSPIKDLVQESWVELLASVHFLCSKGRYTKREALEFLKKEKPHLVVNAEKAYKALKKFKLLK